MAYTVAAAPSWPAPSPAAQAPPLHLKTSEEWGRQEAQRVLRLFMPRVPEILLVPNLRLLYQGPVVQLGFRVKRLKKRHAFLFPGILVIARQLPGGKYNPRWLIALSSRKAVSAVVDSQYFIKDGTCKNGGAA